MLLCIIPFSITQPAPLVIEAGIGFCTREMCPSWRCPSTMICSWMLYSTLMDQWISTEWFTACTWLKIWALGLFEYPWENKKKLWNKKISQLVSTAQLQNCSQWVYLLGSGWHEFLLKVSVMGMTLHKTCWWAFRKVLALYLSANKYGIEDIISMLDPIPAHHGQQSKEHYRKFNFMEI